MSSLAELLRKRREELELSFLAASKLTGVSDDYLKVLEGAPNRGTGRTSEPSPTVLRKLASGYGLSYIVLMDACGYLPEELPADVLETLADPRNKGLVEALRTPEQWRLVAEVIQRIRGN